MIEYQCGSIFESKCDALVNPVNTVGVMGAGLAAEFKERYPANFEAYARACREGEVRIGKVYVTPHFGVCPPDWIINFPTKTHWKMASQLHWIRAGLDNLRRAASSLDLKSVAIPALGCGCGGLAWPSVRAQIESELNDVTETRFVVYAPHCLAVARGDVS